MRHLALALAVAIVGPCALPMAQAASSNPIAEPGEVLLVLQSGDTLAALQQKYGLSLISRFGARPIFRMKVPGGTDAGKVAGALSAEPGVVVADLNYRRASPESVKNNVLAIGNPQAYATQWADAALGLPKVRSLASGQAVRVAVLDTGFDLAHPALAGRWLPGRDFVDGDLDPTESPWPLGDGYGHGTHVAGLVAWVAPGARIMPLRVLDANGGGNTWALAEAMLYAVDPDGNPATDDGAQVINLSLAGLQRTRLMDTIHQIVGCNPPDPLNTAVDTRDAGYNDDQQRCASHGGAVVVAGAGNDGSSALRAYPAAEGAYSLLAVAASTAQGKLAGFSNSGGWIHLAAPGEAITSTVPGGGYATWSGTSMATPLVAGAAALVRQLYPQLTARDVARCLEATTTGLSGTKLRQLNINNALKTLAADPTRCH
jgi:subtilisin family serine protease